MHDNQNLNVADDATDDSDDPYGTVIHRFELEFTEYEFAEDFGSEVFYNGEPPWDVGTVGVVGLGIAYDHVDYGIRGVIDKVRGAVPYHRADVLVALRETTMVEPGVCAMRLSTLTESELESVKKQVASGQWPSSFKIGPARSE